MVAGGIIYVFACLPVLLVAFSPAVLDKDVALEDPVPFEIDKNVKEQLLNDEMLYQRQKEQEVDEAVQVLERPAAL